MGGSVTVVRVTGEDKVALRIRGISKNMGDLTPAWRKTGTYLSGMVRQQFTSQGARLGTPWRPLKPEYRLWKLRNGYGRRMLVMSGEMRNSFTSRKMDIEHYSPLHAEFGSDNQKAIWHQYGTHKDGKQINPPRPMLVLTPEIRQKIRDIVADSMMGRA